MSRVAVVALAAAGGLAWLLAWLVAVALPVLPLVDGVVALRMPPNPAPMMIWSCPAARVLSAWSWTGPMRRARSAWTWPWVAPGLAAGASPTRPVWKPAAWRLVAVWRAMPAWLVPLSTWTEVPATPGTAGTAGLSLAATLVVSGRPRN